MKILLQCESCEASFCVQHDLGDRFYTLQFCAFCGEPIETDDQHRDELEDEDEW